MASHFFWLGLGLGLGWIGRQLWFFRSAQRVPPASPLSAPDAVSQLQNQLQQTELAYYTAVELSQFKGNFLARTSHELRSPMNGIIGMHQLILENLTDGPEEERAFIAQANISALKMVQLLDTVIDAAKVAQGSVSLHQQPVELAWVVEEVQRLTQLQIQNRNLKLTLTPPPEDHYVWADPARLRQVWVSLVDAAIAQMSDGSLMLTVMVAPDSEQIEFQLTMPVPTSLWLQDSTHPPTWIDQQMVQTLPKAEIVRLAQQPFPEPGFAFAIARSLMSSMQGTLEVVTSANQSEITQIHGTIPRMLPDASID